MLISLARSADTPLHRQIYLALRASILEQRLRSGARLPATRVLAADLGVSRTTVLCAYDQLAAEGFITGLGGGGTRVAPALAVDRRDASLQAATARGARKAQLPELSPFNDAIRAAYSIDPSERDVMDAAGPPRRCMPLAPGYPALDAFPVAMWARLTARRWRRSATTMLRPDDGPGYKPLREAISQYVVTARAVRCTADQVIVTAGAQQAINLAARVLVRPGDTVWMEEPGYAPARAAFAGVGARVLPIPVDSEGLCVSAGRAAAPAGRLAFITPSFQAPMGTVMSLTRRLELLDWADAARAWVLEDDYNGEFCYDGASIAALQGFEHHGARRVIFVGTFSKTLFPSLRLGFAVVPPELVESFALARRTADRHSPVIDQAVLADFIAGGHFARHVRRMRTLYAERQRALVKIARRELGSLLRVDAAPAGMRLLGWLPRGVSDRRVAAEAARRGVSVVALSDLRMAPSDENALVLGFAPFTAAEMRRAVRALGDAIRDVGGKR
jgi:GntR family transcriptional regulator/MocR family aminotransferase